MIAYWFGVAGLLEVAGLFWEPEFFPRLAPEPSSALETLWQVHATLVAVGFAGLALIFQLGIDPPMAAKSARATLIEVTHTRRLLLVAGATTLILGAVALWLQTHTSVIVGLILITAPTVMLVGLTYWRALAIFSDHSTLEGLTNIALLDSLDRAIQDTSRITQRNESLRQTLDGMAGI